MLKVITTMIIAALTFFADVPTATAVDAAQIVSAPAQAQQIPDVDGFGQALSSESLAAQSGRQATQIDKVDVLANLTNGLQEGNTMTGPSITGYNSISEGAFTNMAGFATVIQNTGNQVLIQNDLIVNVTMN